MKLIGITGKARAGKDTIATHLAHTHAFTRIAFADPLKLAAQQMFGLTNTQTWDDNLKETVIPMWGLSPRQIFQRLGTDAMRGTFGQDVWLRRFVLSYHILRDTDDVVVPDVRFDNEAMLIKDMGGTLIQVIRGDGLRGDDGIHASEAGVVVSPDIVIVNQGSIADLKHNIDRVLGL
jgi:hypothetical protein